MTSNTFRRSGWISRVQPLGDAVDAQVDFDVAVRQTARDLFTGEDVVRVRARVHQLPPAADRVVIGNRHHVHASPLRRAVDVERRRIAVAAAQEAQASTGSRVAGMHVQIGASDVARMFTSVMPSERLQKHYLQNGRTDATIARRKKTVPDIGAKDRLPNGRARSARPRCP